MPRCFILWFMGYVQWWPWLYEKCLDALYPDDTTVKFADKHEKGVE